MVGDLMENGGDVAAARAAYAKPKPGSPEYPAARSSSPGAFQNANSRTSP